MSEAYNAVVSTLKSRGQEALVEHLTRNAGHGIGLELREGTNVLNAKNKRRVRAGMVFNVCVGVQVSPLSSLPPALLLLPLINYICVNPFVGIPRASPGMRRTPSAGTMPSRCSPVHICCHLATRSPRPSSCLAVPSSQLLGILSPAIKRPLRRRAW